MCPSLGDGSKAFLSVLCVYLFGVHACVYAGSHCGRRHVCAGAHSCVCTREEADIRCPPQLLSTLGRSLSQNLKLSDVLWVLAIGTLVLTLSTQALWSLSLIPSPKQGIPHQLPVQSEGLYQLQQDGGPLAGLNGGASELLVLLRLCGGQLDDHFQGLYGLSIVTSLVEGPGFDEVVEGVVSDLGEEEQSWVWLTSALTWQPEELLQGSQ